MRPDSLVEELLSGFHDDDLAAALGRHLRDAVPHQATANDADLFDLHRALVRFRLRLLWVCPFVQVRRALVEPEGRIQRGR